jgi:hypothetical protein
MPEIKTRYPSATAPSTAAAKRASSPGAATYFRCPEKQTVVFRASDIKHWHTLEKAKIQKNSNMIVYGTKFVTLATTTIF